METDAIGTVVFTILALIGFAVATDWEEHDQTRSWKASRNKPNIIIFNADDMGWGDISSYGHPTQEWSPIDDMAVQGMRFTNFYSAAATCSPSRSALLTGRLPIRTGVWGEGRVFYLMSPTGLPRYEITIAEALQDVGYVTGMIGKWHLGINAYSHTDGEHLPYNHGFEYVGTNLALSNLWGCDEEQLHMIDGPDPLSCMLYKNATIIQQPFSHHQLSEAFVDDAIGFMRDAHKQERPFFLYYGTAQTHVNLYNNKGFGGSSKRGRYGDNIREMAWTIGAIMKEVKRMGDEFNTLAIFTSDNGPFIHVCNEGGDAGILKGGKFNFWEGGVRVPGIFHWPGHIKPSSTSDIVASQMDIFPTLMTIVGGYIPDDRIIDGIDISSTLFNWTPEPQPEPGKRFQIPRVKEPRILVWHCNGILFTVRYGSHKFHFTTQKVWSKEDHHAAGQCGDGGFPFHKNSKCVGCGLDNIDCVRQHDPPLMYNVEQDPNEAYPLDMSLPHHKAVYDQMLFKLQEFQTSLIIGKPLLNPQEEAVWPCCTESFPDCACNYQHEGPFFLQRSVSKDLENILDLLINRFNDYHVT